MSTPRFPFFFFCLQHKCGYAPMFDLLDLELAQSAVWGWKSGALPSSVIGSPICVQLLPYVFFVSYTVCVCCVPFLLFAYSMYFSYSSNALCLPPSTSLLLFFSSVTAQWERCLALRRHHCITHAVKLNSQTRTRASIGRFLQQAGHHCLLRAQAGMCFPPLVQP